MSHTLPITLRSVMLCLPHTGLGRVVALFAFEGAYWFSGKPESITPAIKQGRRNEDQISMSGRGGVIRHPPP